MTERLPLTNSIRQYGPSPESLQSPYNFKCSICNASEKACSIQWCPRTHRPTQASDQGVIASPGLWVIDSLGPANGPSLQSPIKIKTSKQQQQPKPCSNFQDSIVSLYGRKYAQVLIVLIYYNLKCNQWCQFIIMQCLQPNTGWDDATLET